MPKFALCKAGNLAPGQLKQVALDANTLLAVYNLDGEFFATADTCTHGAASLSDGDVEGNEIVCPFHLGAFDIRTGAATRAPCSETLQTYRVTLIDGIAYVDINT